ncbi:helix-turn-helix transcriptional regulator [Pseudomonas putida]|jgi:transcriptional regulator with XRE-family HTH domain|uniref:helix-turn-helix domain-containing protein n=1 Tax=Pseudomonas putida TaxID=303 RepID=UPI002AC3BEB6|nr:helix-turn-helix transcriptional regulator [Pseudomonas putida]MDZ5111798.1 helix-turn-helix transcriptional regulator [Pseudomonas putida]
MNWNVKRAIVQEALKQMRLEAQLTQSDLAKRLGKPQSYVSKYESGERRLDIIEIDEVCQATGQTLTSFANELEKLFLSEPNIEIDNN